ncbi:MAG: PKD domain-containing protein, partial [Saprospiraceae bacterium]|nr:PKD domain-containing protein [Saprospiraceae bacterium]
VAGDGGNHIIGVRDIDDPSCLDQIAISTSNCSLPCSISDISLVLIGGNDPVIHTVAVEDFEFVPKDIEVSIGDVVRWEWTGQIAHTTTSDATNGPDSWDSGLLGQGSSFEETIDELGLHPYYCIPHGAPGGIGMAGTINAIASTPCVDGLVSYQVSFNNLNTGQSGFQVFIDGIPDTGNPFSYTGTGSQTIFISLSGDGTVHELTITDADDSSCTANFSFVVPDCDPTYCSLEATATPISPCGDNSLIEYELSLEALNPGSSGFEVFVDGEELPGSPFSYDPGGVTNLQAFLLGDGGTRMIEFQDLDSLGCQFLLEVNTEDCSLPCFLGLETELLEGCNSEGNLTYEITVIGTGTGSQGFDLALDGNLVPGSPFEYSGGVTNIVLEIPGDGQTHQVEVGDLDSLACTGSLSLDVIDCAAGCLLELDNVSINVPQLFEIQVLDYVFEPAVLTVAVGDTIRFIWLGVIPHTTTSDATSGVDTWNSGLLGQGAVYDLIIETPGEHPYYCVPHGAPGGIGMAGLIIAEEPSDDNLLAVQLDFFADNVGPSGFNLFVDGNPAVTNPQSYATSGFNSVFVELPCDGQAYSVQIIDIDDPECTLETSIQMPDCDDPCFGFESGFTYEVDHPNLTIDLTDLSSPETDIWEWQFGDGDFSSNQNPSHVYAIDGLYEVCLISTDIDLACSDTTCTNIQVGGYFCEASFTLESDGMLISFVDNSMVSEPVSNWVWSIDGQPILQGLAQGDYTFDTLGTYELCLSIEGGACVDDTCMTIDLSDPCLLAQANYSYTINQSELSVNFHDLTTGNPHLWLWGFGDGYTSNDQDPAHTYDEPGIYTVCLLVQDTVNQCNRSYCEKIEVGIVGTRPTEIINHDLVLHPNPGPQGFQGWYLEGLSPNDFGKVLQYKIYGVDGRLYMEGDIRGSKQIYLEKTVDFEAGIYFIQLYSDKRLYQGKAIIQ